MFCQVYSILNITHPVWPAPKTYLLGERIHAITKSLKPIFLQTQQCNHWELHQTALLWKQFGNIHILLICKWNFARCSPWISREKACYDKCHGASIERMLTRGKISSYNLKVEKICIWKGNQWALCINYKRIYFCFSMIVSKPPHLLHQSKLLQFKTLPCTSPSSYCLLSSLYNCHVYSEILKVVFIFVLPTFPIFFPSLCPRSSC